MSEIFHQFTTGGWTSISQHLWKISEHAQKPLLSFSLRNILPFYEWWFLTDKELLKRIGNKINELENNPYPQDIERVEGYKDVKVFRVRVGDYRILYFVDHDANKIYVEKIDRRERVYKRH